MPPSLRAAVAKRHNRQFRGGGVFVIAMAIVRSGDPRTSFLRRLLLRSGSPERPVKPCFSANHRSIISPVIRTRRFDNTPCLCGIRQLLAGTGDLMFLGASIDHDSRRLFSLAASLGISPFHRVLWCSEKG